MTCQTCGASAEATDAFCAGCGSDLRMQVTTATHMCPKCGAAHELGDKYCASCGADLQSLAVPVAPTCAACGAPTSHDDAFCGGCGAPVKATVSAPAGVRPELAQAGIPTSAVGERLLDNWRIGAIAGGAGLIPGLVIGLLLALMGSVSFVPALFSGVSLSWRTTLTEQSIGALEPNYIGPFSDLLPDSGKLQIGALFATVLLVSLTVVLVLVGRKLTQRVNTWTDVAVVAGQPAIVTGVGVMISGILTKTNPLTGLKAALVVFLVVGLYAIVRTGGQQPSLQKANSILSIPVIATTYAVLAVLVIAAVLLLVLLLTQASELGSVLPVAWLLGIPSAAALIVALGTFAGLPRPYAGDTELSDVLDTSSVSTMWTLACLVIIVVVCLCAAALMILRRGDTRLATRDLGIWAAAWFVVGLLTMVQLSMSFSLNLIFTAVDGRLRGPTAVVITTPLVAVVCWWVATLILTRLPAERLQALQARARALPPRSREH